MQLSPRTSNYILEGERKRIIEREKEKEGERELENEKNRPVIQSTCVVDKAHQP